MKESWKKPELTVIVRGKAEESALASRSAAFPPPMGPDATFPPPMGPDATFGPLDRPDVTFRPSRET